jgi:hypothetical protein
MVAGFFMTFFYLFAVILDVPPLGDFGKPGQQRQQQKQLEDKINSLRDLSERFHNLKK